MTALPIDLIRRTRQHHAIEHATLHMLAARLPHQRFTGYSTPLGFTIVGDVGEPVLRRAVGDALLRLQAGESDLALHPNCGTNLAATGLLVTLVAVLAAGGRRSFLERFTGALLLVLPALVMSQPLGYRLQRYTTSADVADRWVAEIRPLPMGSLRAHQVLFD